MFNNEPELVIIRKGELENANIAHITKIALEMLVRTAREKQLGSSIGLWGWRVRREKGVTLG
jgi:hypothetical protein